MFTRAHQSSFAFHVNRQLSRARLLDFIHWDQWVSPKLGQFEWLFPNSECFEHSSSLPLIKQAYQGALLLGYDRVDSYQVLSASLSQVPLKNLDYFKTAIVDTKVKQIHRMLGFRIKL